MIRRLTFAAILLLAAAQAWAFGEIRYADRALNVRKARSLESEHVKTLQPGDQVRVDHLRDGWYAVYDLSASDPDEAKALGYAKSSFLLPVTKEAAPAPAPKAQAPAVPAPAAAETKIPVNMQVPEVTAPVQVAPPAQASKPQPVASIIPSEIKAAAVKVSVRTARAVNSPVSTTLNPGQRVQTAFFRDGWYAVFKLDAKNLDETKALGFVHASELLPETPGVKPLAQIVTPPAPPAAAPQPAAPAAQANEVTEAVQPAPVVPGETQPAKSEAQTPVKITADRMTYVEKDHKVTFSGNVQAEHEGLRLWAATLSAYFMEGGKSAQGGVSDNIDRIVADGGVKMKKEKSEGTCRTLTYFVKDGVLRMEGDPRLNDGGNSVAGEVIKFYVKDNRSEVLGGQNKRVEAVFTVPEGAKKP